MGPQRDSKKAYPFQKGKESDPILSKKGKGRRPIKARIGTSWPRAAEDKRSIFRQLLPPWQGQKLTFFESPKAAF